MKPYPLLSPICLIGYSRTLQSIILAVALKNIHIVTPCGKLDAGTTVNDIQTKQGILETAGQRRTLKLNAILVIK